MSKANAQRTVNVMKRAIEKNTRDGATNTYKPAVIYTGGSQIVSAYVAGETTYPSEDIRVPAGAYLSPGDYVIVGMSIEGKSWIDEIMPYSAYSEMVLDYNNAQLKIGSGSAEPSIGDAGQLLFSGGPTAAMYWDDNFAGELRIPVKNNTGATLTAGTAVYISSVSGQIAVVSKASATSEPTSSKTLGLVTKDIADTAQGYVTTFGIIKNVNVPTAYTPGTSLWLSPTAGEWTDTKPVVPNHLVSIGKVIHNSTTAGRIFVSIQNGFELEELHNVYIQSTPSDGQALVYDAASAYWKPGAAASGVSFSDSAYPSALGTSAYGASAYASRRDHVHPTTGLQVSSEKYQANGYVGLNGSTIVPSAYLGTGTASSVTYLRGDSTWASIPSLSQVGVKVIKTNAAALTSGASTAMIFSSTNYSKPWDESTPWHNVSNSTTQIKPIMSAAAKLLVQAQIRFTGSASTGAREAKITLNGTTDIAIERVPAGAGDTSVNLTVMYEFNGSTDYIELYALASTTGVSTVASEVWLSVNLPGGAKGDTGPEGGTTLVTSSSATNSSVADAATAQTILSSNSSRKGFSIYNDSSQVAYVKFGSAATTTDFTMKLAAYGFYEMFGDCLYTGAITAIWAADSTGSARVTEW